MFNNFSVLTGETGSGKSILLDALGLAIGYRSNNRLLRKGSSQGLVAAEFEIENNQECKEILLENGLINPDNPNILILRRILLEGSSKAFVNDVAVGVNLLAKIGATLIEIHGQHEQSNLLETSFHRKILDQYASNKELLAKVNKIFDDLDNTKKELQKLHDQAANNEREKDYLIHIIKELEEAHLEENEEEILTNKRNVILSSEKISNLMSEVLSEVSEADSQIFCANRSLIRNQSLGNFIDEEENKLEILTNILDEISIKNDQAKSLIDQIMSNIGGGNESLE
ncbi:MAG: DNA repair protein RecN (Recombination protein N), partial [Myxococcota bacterium]